MGWPVCFSFLSGERKAGFAPAAAGVTITWLGVWGGAARKGVCSPVVDYDPWAVIAAAPRGRGSNRLGDEQAALRRHVSPGMLVCANG